MTGGDQTGAAPQRPRDVAAWLQRGPSLAELVAIFPREWQTVQRDLDALGSGGDPEALERYVASLSTPVAAPPGRPAKRDEQALVAAQVRRQMAAKALQQARLAATTGVTAGKVRFNLVNGWVAQKLLFERGLERKPVSMPAFRLLWPLLPQRRRLMPLVEPQGIYCFYSRRLVAELAELIDGRPCLEIGAGDGTLARFLSEAGVAVTATDDFSWQHSICYPEDVRRLGAREALSTYRPAVVVCSWPPPGNGFERHVFKTRSVDLYIVIGSRHQVASGNWSDYHAQTAFEFAEEPKLSRLVLPPEIEPAVYVFRRIARSGRPPGAAADRRGRVVS